MGRVCMVPDVVAEFVMGRVCHGPSLLWVYSRIVSGQAKILLRVTFEEQIQIHNIYLTSHI